MNFEGEKWSEIYVNVTCGRTLYSLLCSLEHRVSAGEKISQSMLSLSGGRGGEKLHDFFGIRPTLLDEIPLSLFSNKTETII